MDYLQRLVEARREMMDEVWPAGRNSHAPWDGTHYSLKGHARPVSVSRTEAYFLSNLVILGRPDTVFEIGTGFGYSAAWLGMGLATAGHGRLITLDNYSEGSLGVDGLIAAEKFLGTIGVDEFVDLAVGSSPVDVPKVLGERSVDIAFIDANHHGEHPVGDYESVRPLMCRSGAIVFHDVDDSRYTVSKATKRAADDGWRLAALQTSCFLTVAYVDPRWTELIAEAFDAARRGEFSMVKDADGARS
ncbi:class I SAM-dependent methyltransferase [Catellatospora tritici]|uniref:class I SAM-dependent methyltransferase n=1 Tax=Catellatospora tritici TaxID=2851566 RepID=UPI001C2D5DCE|nr:class I SAM-dependent methyltransferase [Catellatospora tritici]MBV1856568.1 class I SAM-dependent methyltransferase [Catellatospora tritici]